MRGEALKGHLDLLLLACLRKGPRHGYAIIEHLRARSGGRFDLPEGTVYPALHRLEHGGLVESTWAEGTPRPRRVYALMSAGESALRLRHQEWDAFRAGVAGVLGE
jgi:PadR family transcriptional regulator PadR